MLRKVGLVSALLLALPAFANAWTVTAKIGSGAGTVVSGAKTIAKPGTYVGYYKVANEPLVANQTFTVDPAAGYSISSVIVNGAAVTPVVDVDGTGTVIVAAGTPIKNSQSLVAYFKQNLLSVDAIQATGGKVTVQRCNAAGTEVYGSLSMTGLAGLKSGSFVKVTAMPNSDYKVASVDGDTLAAGLQGDIVSKVVAVTAAGQDVTADFDLVSIVKADLVASKYVANPLEVVQLDASKTVANVAGAVYTYASSATDAVIVPAGNKATVKFPTEGTFTVTVTATMPDTTYSEDVVSIKVATNNACMTCHSNRNPGLMASVQSGKHSFGVLTGHSGGTCQRCHSTEGYNAYVATTGVNFVDQTGYTAIADKDAAGNILLTNVSCFACHNNHDSVLRDTPAQWDPKYVDGGASATQQFKLCTSCHGLVNGAGAPIASGSVVSGTTTVAMQKHNGDWYRNIASTHYDLPSTGVGLTTTYVEGYNVRYNKESACTDCHGHDFYTNSGKALEEVDAAKGAEFGESTIHTDWAQSGHAGGLLKAKFEAYTLDNPLVSGTYGWSRTNNATKNAAVMAAGVTGTSGPAWEHYSWDDSSRSACQKCHTSTGVSNYLDAVNTFNNGGADKVVYNAASNDFSHLVGWTSTNKTSAQNEMLYCWGCHNNAGTGALRVDGAMTLDYKAATTDTTNIVLAAPVRAGVANGKSAACVSCHAGRGNVVSLMGTTASDPGRVLDITTTPKNTASATSTHYLNAAATIFKDATKVGYEFVGGSYANPSYYKHNWLGCADCHMPNKSHKFEVVEKNATGAVTALLGTSCVGCHTTWTDGALAVSVIEEEAEGYKQALELLDAALIAKGYVWTPNHPYFMLDANADGAITAADKLAKFTDPTTGAVAYYPVPTTTVAALTKAAGWTDVDKNNVINDLDVANVGPLWPNEGDLGAAHNYNYLFHEPGAYAHNRKYAKRLIWDSIDWLDNGALNGSIVIPAELTHAAAWLGTARP